ncbi:MAG: OmpA family protein [Paracoccaceae bacterium]
MKYSPRVLGLAAFVLAATISLLAASWAVRIIENRSREAVNTAIITGGQSWATVEADGLQLRISGTAPSEAQRFRALSVAGSVIDDSRVIDAIEVAEGASVAAPDFVVEILSNDQGISLIGLVPTSVGKETVVEAVTAIDSARGVTDMLETADYPVPDGWENALAFGIDALAQLPRAKISVRHNAVTLTAIGDSAEEKARLERKLAADAPDGVLVTVVITAPRPVITPYMLRFLIDADGARFDACSADTEEARTRILTAATVAGATGAVDCTVGLGAPSPRWAEAAEQAIGALAELGGGSITIADADVSLIAAETVSQRDFDRVVGELDADLPEVFSLQAVLTPKPVPGTSEGPPQFTATLAEDGRVDLRGLLSNPELAKTVENYARARFGAEKVYMATRNETALPRGWPVRVLAGLGALAEVSQGSVTVEPEMLRIEGASGDRQTNDRISALLTELLGPGAEFRIQVRYDAALDPLAALPTPEECVKRIGTILSTQKISFEPGSPTIDSGALKTVDEIANVLKGCPEMQIEIAGHTDDQGREEMNLNLSQQRAEAVLQALMQRRVLTAGITAKGYGEAVPIADNDSEAGRESNRRIEFTLTPPPATGEQPEAPAGGAAPEAQSADDGATGEQEQGSGDGE